MIEYCEKYNPLFDIQKGVDTFIVTGGRFTGKSYAVSLAAFILVNNHNRKLLATRYSMASAKNSIIPEYEEKINGLKLSDYYKTVGNSIIGASQREIVFSGIKTSSGNQTGKLKSLKGFSVWTLEEAEEMVNESEFTTIKFSIRAKDVNYTIIVLNPTIKTHWIYEKFFEKKGVAGGFNGIVGNVCYIHTTYNDVKQYVPTSIMNDIKELEITDPEKYEHVILGKWLDKADGVIFKNWRVGTFDDSLPFIHGLDFGFFPDPDAFVKIAIDQKRKKLYVKEIYYGYETKTEELGEILLTETKGGPVVHDTNEPRTANKLKSMGVSLVKAKKGAGSVLDGFRLLKDFEIIVEQGSKNIITELNNFVEKNGVPIGDYDHAISAIRYAFMSVQKNTTKQKTLPRQIKTRI